MRVSDLVRDDATGRASHTKLWNHVGNAAMTTAFLRVVWTAGVSEGLAWLFLVYGGLVGGSQLASKFIGAKWGTAPTNGQAAAPKP